MLSKRFERLNTLAKINAASTYLEIGVNKGETFLKIDIPHKVAVDPLFLFDTKRYASQSTIFYEVASDEFFTQYAPKQINYKFDLIYLDGLHTFEQTFRDFCASLQYAHAKTIWLIDDTHPISFLSALPDIERVRKLRKFLPGENSAWMGDVFKVVFAIHDFFPQFSYATFLGHGQTAIWQETRANFSPAFKSFKEITDLGYDGFLELKEPLSRIYEATKIIDCISAAFH